jgi:hypothetical protein
MQDLILNFIPAGYAPLGHGRSLSFRYGLWFIRRSLQSVVHGFHAAFRPDQRPFKPAGLLCGLLSLRVRDSCPSVGVFLRYTAAVQCPVLYRTIRTICSFRKPLVPNNFSAAAVSSVSDSGRRCAVSCRMGYIEYDSARRGCRNQKTVSCSFACRAIFKKNSQYPHASLFMQTPGDLYV